MLDLSCYEEEVADLCQTDVHHTECSGATNTGTAVNHGRSHPGVQYPRTSHCQEVLQEHVWSLGYSKIRPLEVVEVEHSPCLLSLDVGERNYSKDH